MIDKEYLDKLKEEDYIDWDNLINDPLVTGGGPDDGLFGCMMFIILLIGATLILTYIF